MSVAELLAKSLRSWSPTWCADAVVGSTRSSGKPHFALRKGAPRTNSSATTARPAETERRITAFAARYQNISCTGLGVVLRRNRCGRLRASSRSPSSQMAAGVTITAAAAANATVAMPA